MKKTKPEKGCYGYIRYQKRIRLLRTVLCFAAAFAIYLIGYLLNDGDKKNIYTIIAMLGIIPASLSCVGAIMMGLRKPMDEVLYRDVKEAAGSLNVAYELYFTTHDTNLFVDAAAVADGTVAAFTHEDVKQDVIRFMEDHIEKSLRASGHRMFAAMPAQVASCATSVSSRSWTTGRSSVVAGVAGRDSMMRERTMGRCMGLLRRGVRQLHRSRGVALWAGKKRGSQKGPSDCVLCCGEAPLYSRPSTQARTSARSAVGSKRATTLPARSMTNLVKFHLMSALLA